MGRTSNRSNTPRAMIHKRILDYAESHSGASMAEIGDEVGGASTELVERVLEQYGDPADDQPSSQDNKDLPGEKDEPNSTDKSSQVMEKTDQQDEVVDQENYQPESSGDRPTKEENGDRNIELVSPPEKADQGTTTDENGLSPVSPSELTEKQVKTLRLINETPNASQGELAEALDVTATTISRWLNDIPDFEWTKRQEVARTLLELESDQAHEESTIDNGTQPESRASEPNHSDPETTELDRFDELNNQLETVKDELEQMKTEVRSKTGPLVVGSKLAPKVVYASINSGQLTEEEELQLLKELMG